MFPSDNPPPYAHVLSSAGWALVSLGDDEESVREFGRFEMKDWEVLRAEMIVRNTRVRLLKKWEELHEPMR